MKITPPFVGSARRAAYRLAAVCIATAAAGQMLILAPQAASADSTYRTHNGAVPSGPNKGDDEPGPGARITNKAFGYYIGRAMPGSHFTQVGGRASHFYGRFQGHNKMNMCGWIHRSARGEKVGHRSARCSKALADSIWQRTTIGQSFSAPAGTKGHNGVQVTVTRPGCRLYYNYFDGTNFQHGKLRDRTGIIGTSNPAHTVRYRYQTRDGNTAVIFDDRYGWGFTRSNCIDLSTTPVYQDPDTGPPPRF
jgi:hypothetical protein